jgi:hypothetical protein
MSDDPIHVVLRAPDLVIGGHKAKNRRRKPTLAAALKQAGRAGVEVSRCEINTDGSIVLVMRNDGDRPDNENEKPEDILELLK